MLRAILISLLAANAPANLDTGYTGPGLVIAHSPAASGIYLGSPGIVILESGSYLAKCDEFGPGSTNTKRGVSLIFSSSDKGRTWQPIARVQDIYWANVFTHGNDIYLMGTTTESGKAAICRSRDAGKTWTTPTEATSGLLLASGHFHTGPCPVPEHDGRFWRAYEEEKPPANKGDGPMRAFVMSAPVDSDLLNAKSWTVSDQITSKKTWLDGTFANWQEGSAVIALDGSILDILRVNQPHWPERAAMISFGKDGKKPIFNPNSDIIDLPGGGKRFTIRFDEKSKMYWSLVNEVPPADQKGEPESVRNTLALIASRDLRNWEVRAVLLHHHDAKKHGFQYADWQIEGDDLVAVVRTAADDNAGEAHNFHDSNFLTFHRFENFRQMH